MGNNHANVGLTNHSKSTTPKNLRAMEMTYPINMGMSMPNKKGFDRDYLSINKHVRPYGPEVLNTVTLHG